MYSTLDYAQQLLDIEQSGIVVMHNISRFSAYHTDFVCPYLTLLLSEQGTARALYDLQEATQRPNDVACILPGHLLHPIENTDDFRATIVVLSNRIFRDLQFHIFSHDYDKFNVAPICSLTPVQARRVMAIFEQLETVSSHSEEELPHRYNMLLSLLAIGYEYLNFYRREQDARWSDTRHAGLLNRFCNLVVEHYRDSRDVKFYADSLHLSPKHFSRVIRSLTGGMSPADWIEQYVVAQARHLLATQQLTVKEVAYRLGYTESASFCRFFKRATGLTPQQYRDTLPARRN